VKQQSVRDFEHHHQTYIEEWYKYEKNIVRIFHMHTNRAFREYLAWYQRVVCIKLHQRWTDDDYMKGRSSVDEDTTYDMRTQKGSHVEMAPILDHLVCFLLTLPLFRTMFVSINISSVVGC
jgi:hypothetical protein